MRFFNKIYNEELNLITSIEDLRVYLHIKKKYGLYKYKEVYDSTDSICNDTTLTKARVVKALENLKTSGLITAIQKDGKDYYKLPVMDGIEEWRKENE